MSLTYFVWHTYIIVYKYGNEEREEVVINVGSYHVDDITRVGIVIYHRKNVRVYT